MHDYETRRVEYHSIRWAELVEQGWHTVTVADGIATMTRCHIHRDGRC